jgi:hypothetical protein
MTNQERYRSLAAVLGLSGGWLEVSRKSLVDRQVLIPSGCYFLAWSDFAILWLEGEQGYDHRVPPSVAWLYAWYVAESMVSGAAEFNAFRACQEFAHREALLRTVGFHQYEGPFGLMECIATPVPWEWK